MMHRMHRVGGTVSENKKKRKMHKGNDVPIPMSLQNAF